MNLLASWYFIDYFYWKIANKFYTYYFLNGLIYLVYSLDLSIIYLIIRIFKLKINHN